ncbi:MAG: flagellar protein FlgN [Planctomycetes bacterium]|nr:flagellar protein FlgN [Planctomycetota bacterium]
MSTAALDIERSVLALLIVLKQESEAMAQVETWLSQLQERVVQRDESALEGLLKEIQTQQRSMPELERKRQQIRLELAGVLGIPFEEMTLTRLMRLLKGEIQNQVSRMRDQLQSQTQALRVQHRGAVMFLTDCARFNRQLLNSVFDNVHQDVTTYSPRGNAERKRTSDLVNMQF